MEKVGFLRSLLSGPDNTSVAIGRFVGLLVAAQCIMFVPLLVAGIFVGLIYTRGLSPADAQAMLFAFMDKLVTYVPAMSITVAGLVAGTAFTEPKSGG